MIDTALVHNDDDDKNMRGKNTMKYKTRKLALLFFLLSIYTQAGTNNHLPKCSYYYIKSDIKEVNVLNKPKESSQTTAIIGNKQEVCIYKFDGKWGETELGWINRKNLVKDYVKTNYLLADIDHDHKNERLEWKSLTDKGDACYFYQLRLFDDDGTLLWSGSNNKDNYSTLMGNICDGEYMPVVLSDINQDGNIDLIIGGQPHEAVSEKVNIFGWKGKKFVKENRLDLIWIDAPNGKTLKWVKLNDNIYSENNRILWAHDYEQSDAGKTIVITIDGWEYPETKRFFQSKAQIHFTPSGAVIDKWIK